MDKLPLPEPEKKPPRVEGVCVLARTRWALLVEPQPRLTCLLDRGESVRKYLSVPDISFCLHSVCTAIHDMFEDFEFLVLTHFHVRGVVVYRRVQDSIEIKSSYR